MKDIQVYVIVAIAVIAIGVLVYFLIKGIKKTQEPVETKEKENEKPTLSKGLKKTKEGVFDRLLGMLKSGVEGDEFLEIEAMLYEADIGVNTVKEILDRLRLSKLKGNEAIEFLKQDIKNRLIVPNIWIEDLLKNNPVIILMVGVNGSGKTTTIGKLAYRFKKMNKSVSIVAGDTFRAAAVEQLKEWADRSGADFFGAKEGEDPGASIFRGVKASIERGVDLIFIDTAGRLHTKVNLMKELKKIKRSSEKAAGKKIDLTLLVIDANTGQNGLNQARIFKEEIGLDGVVVTKLDGTAKGGILISISDDLKLPIYYVGVGEKIDDLVVFNSDEYIKSLFNGDKEVEKEAI